MKKVLITLPDSIAGRLILNGFASGLKKNGCFVLEKDVQTLTIEDIEKFKPDIVFGYDYGYLLGSNEDVINYLLNQCSAKIVHYFADEPDDSLSYKDKPELYSKLKEITEENGRVFNFIWDKDLLDVLPNNHFLRLAVNYKAYRPREGKVYDISFVGRPLTEKRQRILAALVKKFGKKLNIFCYEKHFLQSLDDMKNTQLLNDDELDVYKSAYRGFLTTERELADVYYNSNVNINITLQGKSGLNYRVFEVPASQGFLLTDEMDGIDDSFVPSKEIETYKNIDDLLDKTEFYLKHCDISQKIAIMGYACVTKCHSFTARARVVLDVLKESNRAH